MGTVLIEENQAHDIFSALYQAQWLVTNLGEKGGVPEHRAAEWLRATERLTQSVAELRTILDQGAKVPVPISRITKRFGGERGTNPAGKRGRPKQTVEQKLQMIAELEAQKSRMKYWRERDPICRKIRRLKRELPAALRD